MKTIIIRKPKFMRNDDVMRTYISVAETISKEACRPERTTEQRFELLSKVSEYMGEAAKAGGFRNISDMCRWMARNTTK